jgi:hypothetical protein
MPCHRRFPEPTATFHCPSSRPNPRHHPPLDEQPLHCFPTTTKMATPPPPPPLLTTTGTTATTSVSMMATAPPSVVAWPLPCSTTSNHIPNPRPLPPTNTPSAYCGGVSHVEVIKRRSSAPHSCPVLNHLSRSVVASFEQSLRRRRWAWTPPSHCRWNDLVPKRDWGRHVRGINRYTTRSILLLLY